MQLVSQGDGGGRRPGQICFPGEDSTSLTPEWTATAKNRVQLDASRTFLSQLTQRDSSLMGSLSGDSVMYVTGTFPDPCPSEDA